MTAFFCIEHGTQYILDDTTSGSFVCTKCGHVFTSCTPQETISTSSTTTMKTSDDVGYLYSNAACVPPVSLSRRTSRRALVLITCENLENMCEQLFNERVDVESVSHATRLFYDQVVVLTLPKISKTLVVLIILCHVLECHGHVIALRALLDYVNLHVQKTAALELPSMRTCGKILKKIDKQKLQRIALETNAVERYTTNLLYKLELIEPTCCTCVECRKNLIQFYTTIKERNEKVTLFTFLIFYCVYKRARDKKHANFLIKTSSSSAIKRRRNRRDINSSNNSSNNIVKTLAYWTNVPQPYYFLDKIVA